MTVKDIDDFGEIGKRPCQPVDFVDDDHLEFGGFDVLEKALEGRALHRAAGEAAIVVHGGKRDPSGVPLARYVSLTGFALRIEGVELLLEAVDFP